MLDASSALVLVSTIVLVLVVIATALSMSAPLSADRPVEQPAPQLSRVGAGSAGGRPVASVSSRPGSPLAKGGWSATMASYADRLPQLALLVLTAALATRAVAVGHAPYSNQYEFAVAFAWGITAAGVAFQARFGVRTLNLVVAPVAVALLLYARAVGAETNPLLPALQHRWLLAVHVAAAVLAYGAAAVACGAAGLSLFRERIVAARPTLTSLPSADRLDEVSYRAAIVAFPLMTLMLILGAIWADLAWGTYWNWDPKETSALFTWLIYGAYLHARVVTDWRGRRANWLLVAGFAAVLFTYFGNLFFGGLHAYA